MKTHLKVLAGAASGYLLGAVVCWSGGADFGTAVFGVIVGVGMCSGCIVAGSAISRVRL